MQNSQPKTNEEKNFSSAELILIGIGSMIGSGIFSVTCIVSSCQTGPAIIVSYLCAGILSLVAGLTYIYIAKKIPKESSIYGYSYVVLGKKLSWITFVGVLIELLCGLSYSLFALSEYCINLLKNVVKIPSWINSSSLFFGIINIPCLLTLIFILCLLYFGFIGGKYIRRILFFTKILAISALTICCIKYFNAKNLTPFLPFGTKSIFSGSSSVLISFYGFSNLVYISDKCKNPKKDVPIGMTGSILITCVVYIFLSTIISGLAPYQNLNSLTAVFDILTDKKEFLGVFFLYLGGITGLIFLGMFFFFPAQKMFDYAVDKKLLPERLSQKKILYPVFGLAACILPQILPLIDIMQINSVGIEINYISMSIAAIAINAQSKNPKRKIFSLALVMLLISLYLILKQFLSSPQIYPKVLFIYLICTLSAIFYTKIYKKKPIICANQKYSS